MSKVHNISNYTPSSDDLFFFDNNIWMFLFCPIANYRKDKQKKYSSFFHQVSSTNASIWINALVLSEFCNAWLRIEYNSWRKKPENLVNNDYKKDFVSSGEYKETIQEIKSILPQIISITLRSSDNFNSINLNAVYAELENCDFNDSYYLELAHQNKWKIVTDDADLFKNNMLDVEIITANIR